MQTIYDAMKSSQHPLQTSLFKAIATTDQLFAVLPFVPKDGEGFDYTREKSLPSPDFVADGHTSVTEGTGEQELVSVPKREIAHDLYIRNFAAVNTGDSHERNQTVMAFKAAGRKIADKVINGAYISSFTIEAFQSGDYVDAIVANGAHQDTNRYGPGEIKYVHTGTLISYRAPGDRTFGTAVAAASDGNYTIASDNPNKWLTVTLDVSDATADAIRRIDFTSTSNEFDGLIKLISTSQVRSSTGTNGDEPTFDILEELLDSVKVKENLVFIMNATLRRKYSALFRAFGGESRVTLPNDAGEVLSYLGIPLLTNDWITSAESKGAASTLSSIYLASLTAEEGLWMGAAGGPTVDVMADPRNVSVLGFRLFDLGQIQAGASSFGKRLVWYGALALGSDLAAARAKEIITA